jgi:RNA polymerase sigma factor (sigma-70 family)
MADLLNLILYSARMAHSRPLQPIAANDSELDLERDIARDTTVGACASALASAPTRRPSLLPTPPPTSTVVGLFRTNARKITNFLSYRLRNREDAEDAAQEVFLRLWKREVEGSLRDEATGYMNTAVHNVAIDLDRMRISHAVDTLVDVHEVDLPDQRVPQDEQAYWREGVVTLVHLLEGLPEIVQRVFALYHIEGMSHVEIARNLGISVRSVERHMARALTHCESSLRDFLA